MATTPETPVADTTITEGGIEAPYTGKPTPVMPTRPTSPSRR